MAAMVVGSALSTTSWEKESVVTVVVEVAGDPLESLQAWTMAAFLTLDMVLVLTISIQNPPHLLAHPHV